LPNQKIFIEKVAKYFSSMNLGQINKGLDLVLNKEHFKEETPISLYKYLPRKEVLGDLSNPNKKEFENEKELMINLSKWFIETTPGFGLGTGGSVGGKSQEKAVEKIQETKEVEKDAYDLELAAFDTSKKIALIKEVRAITNLGLKEVFYF
jgi:hypothetical protein